VGVLFLNEHVFYKQHVTPHPDLPRRPIQGGKENFSEEHRVFIVAGVKSSEGKTTVTLGLMEAMRRRGLIVAPFKAGPDYIDPGLHSLALKRPSYNLDTWMMGEGGVKNTFAAHAFGADAAVVEGVMGLFDGRARDKKDTKDRCDGSTASLARALGLPVILVIDSPGMAESAVAIAKGFAEYDPCVKVAGVIFNRVASERHRALIEKAAGRLKDIAVLGFLPKNDSLKLPSRHLGLLIAEDLAGGEWKKFLRGASTLVERHVDVTGLLKISRAASKNFFRRNKPPKPRALPEDSVKIAVARDNAFCFYYEENLDILRQLGAKVVYFSPASDWDLPEGVSGLYIGGGYPELHAKRLAKNSSMRKAVKRAVSSGMPVLAECGGLQYLAKKLVDMDGNSFDMAGVYPFSTRMLKKRKALGYREVETSKACPFLSRGNRVRGHEFHYSEIFGRKSGLEKAFETDDGFLHKNALSSYAHLHFASNPAFAEGFIKACRVYGGG
jgi:cobyrinic acid a,c-diamide synthase